MVIFPTFPKKGHTDIHNSKSWRMGNPVPHVPSPSFPLIPCEVCFLYPLKALPEGPSRRLLRRPCKTPILTRYASRIGRMFSFDLENQQLQKGFFGGGPAPPRSSKVSGQTILSFFLGFLSFSPPFHVTNWRSLVLYNLPLQGMPGKPFEEWESP